MFIPRWKAIANAIHADIGQGKLSSGDALPSETELAAQWNVSRVTAHRAMHELHQQGVVVRKRRAGTIVAPHPVVRLGRVAVFLNTRDFLEQSYLCGIRAGLSDEIDLLYCDIRCDPEREAQYLERMRPATDGIVMLATCDPRNTALLAQLLQSGVNIVCVDSVPDGLDVTSVVSDNYGVSHQALSYLVERGHRHIAHFTVDRMYDSSVRERCEAYRHILAEIGVTDVSAWIRQFPYEMVFDLDGPPGITTALAELMERPVRPTAIFCAHDYLLSAVIQACRLLRLGIPEDLEIVSFTDCPPILPYLPNGVHRIVQQAQEMGKVAAEQLCRQLRTKHSEPEIVRIPPIFYPSSERVRNEA